MKTLMRYLLFAVIVCFGVIILSQESQKKPRPSDIAARKGGPKFRAPGPKSRKLRKQLPIKVKIVQVQRLAEGTHAGNPGDILLTLKGQGFSLTSLAPRIILNENMILEHTEINKDGTELYVIIPAEFLESKKHKLDFEEVIVENPGGKKKIKYARTHFRLKPKDLLEIDPKTRKARLLYKKYFFEKEDVEEKKENGHS
jgi:hypothetical protein